MYNHSYSTVTDSNEIFNFIKANGFATVVSLVEGKLWASHIPLVLSNDRTELIGHLSRGNMAWKNISKQEEVLCIFHGPHAYISSSWYNHENVSTWNYQIAHVYATAQLIEGQELLQSLKDLTDKYEQYSEKPAKVEAMNPAYVAREMKGIVGLQLRIVKVEASFKLSQNRDDVNHQHIVEALEKRGDPPSAEIANAMKKIRG
jgi:transcriptional regulator